MESILTIEDMVAASDFMSTLGGQEAKPNLFYPLTQRQ